MRRRRFALEGKAAKERILKTRHESFPVKGGLETKKGTLKCYSGGDTLQERSQEEREVPGTSA